MIDWSNARHLAPPGAPVTLDTTRAHGHNSGQSQGRLQDHHTGRKAVRRTRRVSCKDMGRDRGVDGTGSREHRRRLYREITSV